MIIFFYKKAYSSWGWNLLHVQYFSISFMLEKRTDPKDHITVPYFLAKCVFCTPQTGLWLRVNCYFYVIGKITMCCIHSLLWLCVVKIDDAIGVVGNTVKLLYSFFIEICQDTLYCCSKPGWSWTGYIPCNVPRYFNVYNSPIIHPFSIFLR